MFYSFVDTSVGTHMGHTVEEVVIFKIISACICIHAYLAKPVLVVVNIPACP